MRRLINLSRTFFSVERASVRRRLIRRVVVVGGRRFGARELDGVHVVADSTQGEAHALGVGDAGIVVRVAGIVAASSSASAADAAKSFTASKTSSTAVDSSMSFTRLTFRTTSWNKTLTSRDIDGSRRMASTTSRPMRRFFLSSMFLNAAACALRTVSESGGPAPRAGAASPSARSMKRVIVFR